MKRRSVYITKLRYKVKENERQRCECKQKQSWISQRLKAFQNTETSSFEGEDQCERAAESN